MPYIDTNTIHNPATGTVAPAAWGDQVRDNLEFLIDPPACSIFETSPQTVPPTANTALTSNEENFDNDAMHSNVSNTSRITAQTAGRYQFIGSANFVQTSTGVRQVTFRIDGTTTLVQSVQVDNAGASSAVAITHVADIILAAGQYVELMARHTHSADLNITMTEFSATFITR